MFWPRNHITYHWIAQCELLLLYNSPWIIYLSASMQMFHIVSCLGLLLGLLSLWAQLTLKKSNLKLDHNDRDYKPTKLAKNLLPNWLGFWDRVHYWLLGIRVHTLKWILLRTLSCKLLLIASSNDCRIFRANVGDIWPHWNKMMKSIWK